MKQIFTQYASYNVWANTQFAEAIKGLTPSYFDKEIESSFPSIRETINHIRSAEYIWLKRLQGTPPTQWPQYHPVETPNEVAEAWLEGSKALALCIEGLQDSDFDTPYLYNDMRGNPQSDMLQSILMHAFNHSSYHRGQLVTLLRQSGITSIPRTDYIVYARGLKLVG